MNKIIAKKYLSENVVEIEVEAPLIARKRQAGHFVILKVGLEGERIPLTIAKADVAKGTITLIVQKVGVTSHKVANLEVGDEITDLVGPLGHPTHIQKYGTVLCAGGGVGVAPLLPIVEAMHQAGNRIISVLAARSKNLVILEPEIRANSDEVIIMTDDGSYGQQGTGYAGNGTSDYQGEGRSGPNHWPCNHDEIYQPAYRKIQYSHNGQSECHYG